MFISEQELNLMMGWIQISPPLGSISDPRKLIPRITEPTRSNSHVSWWAAIQRGKGKIAPALFIDGSLDPICWLQFFPSAFFTPNLGVKSKWSSNVSITPTSIAPAHTQSTYLGTYFSPDAGDLNYLALFPRWTQRIQSPPLCSFVFQNVVQRPTPGSARIVFCSFLSLHILFKRIVLLHITSWACTHG